MSNQEHTDGLTRRTLIKSTALGSLALAAGGLSLPFSLRNAAAAVQDATRGEERIVWGPARSTAAAAARCVHTCVTMKSSGSKPTIPARIFVQVMFRRLVIAMLVGVFAALAVALFRHAMAGLKACF